MNLKLIIGNPNYSSWSLRPWFLLKAFNIHFESTKISLAQENLREALLEYSPSAKVPVLLDRETAIWDSLAICEYINEIHLDGKGWPRLPKDRAMARVLTCEMHSGFFALRNNLPMNIRARRKVAISPAVAADIARIDEIWSAHHASGWLFETFSITDCFFAPVAFRFKTYGIELSDKASAYMEKLLSHPAATAWQKGAAEDHEILDVDEIGEAV